MNIGWIIAGLIGVLIGVLIGASLDAWTLISNHIIVDQNVIIAVSSVFIASCALALTMWHGYKSQEHNKLSVKPHLTIGSCVRNNPISFELTLSNDGLGPAFIKSFKIYFKDTEITTNGITLSEDITSEILRTFPHSGGRSAVNNTTVIKSGEKFVISKNIIKAKETFDVILQAIEKRQPLTRFEIEYHSIYGDKFTLEDSLNGPE